ncbi:MAG: tRNA pseudouridine(55) synthase TruB [Thermoanaerobaculia bacterium]|nr:MAG: tRNA pseudouridine(55) synthase TruB [Thermoanaerobaculia bacterium]
MPVDGLLAVDKQPGGTSHDVVQRVRRIFGQKRIGHCGTLDPDATGLLLVTLGQATRLTRFLIHAPKIYEGIVRLGVETDTYDAAGRVVSESPASGISETDLDREMNRFVGTFEQTLPAFSARKIGGRRLYEMARRGEEVPELTKEVTVWEFRRTGALDADRVPFRLSCTSGTYARALAHDLGARLGCGAHLSSLRRTEIGPFQVGDALDLEEIERRHREGEDLGRAWYRLAGIPLPFRDAGADAQQERRVRNGQTALLSGFDAAEGDWVRLLDRRGEAIAIGSVVERVGAGTLAVVQPRIVFASGPS